ncbi:hypothetical protein Celaphus_00015966 [Cervus elaphus hippelaphus]|uniref:Uncharacterized protein n=1 Tax=Cervus elaphus hippelaphus TaxID=46360 RepID=A0A212C2I3_CEREH|nr:hypothetical protein Celaphus_00015966 [Cervus elaphus hippelaphus]
MSFSPKSIFSDLAMVFMGANSKTTIQGLSKSGIRDCCCKFYQAEIEEPDLTIFTEELRKYRHAWLTKK